MMIKDTKDVKICASENYNFVFNKISGKFARWGKTQDEDPTRAPAPEIADIEVSTICTGIDGVVCPFCYKSNTSKGTNMSLETFKNVVDSINQYNTLTQVAFGADSHATSNPELFDMMKWLRDERGIIPNITVAQIDDEVADKLAANCGAVAVSRYAKKDVCYDSVKKLTDRSMTQVNIHMLLSEETYTQALETICDICNDKRLDKLNAIVFLSLKQKGRGVKYHKLDEYKFEYLVTTCIKNNISFGFDSCGANKFERYLDKQPELEHLRQYCEPCESGLFSIYADVNGNIYPCSFCGEQEPITNVSKEVNERFIEEVWNGTKFEEFRKKLETSCRSCPIFNV